ncbi:general transcription factor 3C polypeptide 2 isoform X2 [Anomaloglossus baeobatrachus]|uniref:general transcription factor 3C polypeptide 2 isoform X2 n=1 Tax=Anomaloglossus baeobatrachus TaxID=238106 RepID=UPI003F4F860E
MDGSDTENCDTLSAEVMVISREDERLPLPAVLPMGVTVPTTGVNMQGPVASLIPSSGMKSLGVNHSPVITAALPNEPPQKKPLSSLPAAKDIPPDTNGPTFLDGSDSCLITEDSSFPQIPTSNIKCSLTLGENHSPTSDTEEPPAPCPVSVLQNSSPLNQRLVNVPRQKGRRPKTKMKTAQVSTAPLKPPSGRKGLGLIQSPVNSMTVHNDCVQKTSLSALPTSQDVQHITTDTPPLDSVDKSLSSEDFLLQKMPVKVPQKRGRKSKAELLLIKAAQELEAPTHVENNPPPLDPVDKSLASEDFLLQQTPVKVPQKRGRKSKAELLLIKAAQELEAPTHVENNPPPLDPVDKSLASEDFLLQQTPVKVPQKRGRRSKAELLLIKAAQELEAPTLVENNPPPLDPVDNSLASEDFLLQQTPVKVPQKRGRRSKAELLLIKAAQELEAPTHVENRQSDSENMEVELTSSGRPRRRAAKTAMKYFQVIANEWEAAGLSSPPKMEKKLPEETGKKRGKKRKAGYSDDDDDVDFMVSEDVLELEEEEVEDEALSEEESDTELCFYKRSSFTPGEKVHALLRGSAENGLHNTIMAPVGISAQITLDFREAQYSDWEYPEWIPRTDRFHFLSQSEAEIYLPVQTTSPPFCIRREGLKEDSSPHILGRFQSLPPHPQRFDVTFFVGGPVWSLDWCPTLWGSSSCQYVVLYCHHGMDDRHRLEVTYTGPALLQLWRLGVLSPDQGGASAASLSYGLAVDDGCIWDLKFCPSGGWEPPTASRKGTEMARLGLLAVAFSSGHVQIYSLPHPESLHSHRKTQGKELCDQCICKVDCIVRLHVGSIKACNPGDNGQCFTVAWLPTKPHQYLAAGFYDGLVAIWDLKTKSVLQKVRQGSVIKQYPFHSFSAHDGAVRSIEWCKADSNFFVTCGSDRRVKFWDLRRLHAPVNSMKRFQGTELTWLLPYCGVVVAQDNCYASHGFCGIHYIDSGFLGYKPYFATPRKGTVWSVSGSDWLSSITSGDITGEVMVIMFPKLNVQYVNTKRPSERRLPVYKVDFQSCAPLSAEGPDGSDHARSEPLAESCPWEHFNPKSFRAASGRFRLLFQDMDMTKFHNLRSREPFKRMETNEQKGNLNMERVQLEGIQKVRFNPNLDSYPWIVSGGHSGLVRVHCVRGLLTSVGQKMIQEKRTRFQAMYEVSETTVESEYSPEIQHCVVEI